MTYYVLVKVRRRRLKKNNRTERRSDVDMENTLFRAPNTVLAPTGLTQDDDTLPGRRVKLKHQDKCGFQWTWSYHSAHVHALVCIACALLSLLLLTRGPF